MLTRDENIVDIEVVVQFRRTDPQAFLFNMRDPEDALNYATASAIREVIGRNLLDFILTDGRAEVASDAQTLLQDTLDSYGAGVTVYEVNLVNANFPSAVEGSVQDSIRAREDRQRRILEASGYSNDILPRARGEAERRRQDAEAYRAQVVADAEGEADRFTQILAEYQKAPAVTRERMYIETLEEILRNSTKVLVDTEGGNNLLYLPLDQLVQRRPSLSPPAEAPTTSPPPAAPSTPVRSRERDTR
jgi:membrane protease subunit HflK